MSSAEPFLFVFVFLHLHSLYTCCDCCREGRVADDRQVAKYPDCAELSSKIVVATERVLNVKVVK